MTKPHRLCVAAAAAIFVAATLSGCSAPPKRETRVERGPAIAKTPAPAPPRARGGGYYLDDGPGDGAPPDLDSIAEPVPRLEALHRGTMRPYVVMGQSFTPMTELAPYKARGVATWYGRRYHGKPTASGETYDMYAISAAHPTLPIPSYVRVTNVATGKSVVVRVNDRGPFLANRLIDLSYTAAHRIGMLAGGSTVVEVETIIPAGAAPASAIAAAQPPVRAATAPPPASAQAPSPGPHTGQDDPILAIAAAAGLVDPVGIPLEPQPQAGFQPALPRPAKTAPLDGAGTYIQLGAFGSRENAESYLVRAQVQVDWLAERMHVLARDGLFRVHAGPYANPAEARQAAERIAGSLGVKPLVVTR